MYYVIYTNSEYFDVLRMHLDFAAKAFSSDWSIVVLADCVDSSCKYDVSWLLYDNNSPYLSRLAYCLRNLSSEYLILAHDVDIPVSANLPMLESLPQFMENHRIKSLELKHLPYSPQGATIPIEKSTSAVQKTRDYIYSQQPTVYHRESFLNLCDTFPHLGYRDAERKETFNFARTHLNAHALLSKAPMQSVYHKCANIYVFLHITKYLKYVPYNPLNTEQLHETVHAAHKQLSELFVSSRDVHPSICFMENLC